jgi:hypothetical protein
VVSLTEVTFHGLRVHYDADVWRAELRGDLHDALFTHRNTCDGDLMFQISGGYSVKEDLHGHLTSDWFRAFQGYPAPIIDVSTRTIADRTIVAGTFPRGFADKDVRVWFATNGEYTAYATIWLTNETAQRDREDCEALIDAIELPSPSSRS